MSTIYVTERYSGHGKQNYYWYEYRKEGNEITKYKCHKRKFFDGHENDWIEDEQAIESWDIDSPSLPDWLHNYL